MKFDYEQCEILVDDEVLIVDGVFRWCFFDGQFKHATNEVFIEMSNEDHLS